MNKSAWARHWSTSRRWLTAYLRDDPVRRTSVSPGNPRRALAVSRYIRLERAFAKFRLVLLEQGLITKTRPELVAEHLANSALLHEEPIDLGSGD